jgi:hypothetical protein
VLNLSLEYLIINRQQPVLTIESGDTVVYETRDVSDNQITPDSTAEAVAALDWDRAYPLAGPVFVEGAEPGDTLAIEILAMETRGWGYTMIIPGFGLLADDFPDPYIRVFDLTNGEFAYPGLCGNTSVQDLTHLPIASCSLRAGVHVEVEVIGEVPIPVLPGVGSRPDVEGDSASSSRSSSASFSAAGRRKSWSPTSIQTGAL